ncbi:MAG: class I SAM-dependent methyltransferase [Haloarculaceae archaeon]
MEHHTFDPEGAERLADPERFAYCSVDELLALFDASPTDRVLDLGSGNGFYADEVAPYVGRLVGLDLQPAMLRRYRERGVPGNVDLVTGAGSALPFPDGAFDAAYSTMAFHEVEDEALAELGRVLRSGGRLGVVDWSAAGEGTRGPPLAERYAAADARERLSAAGFSVTRAEDRRETFVVAARV